MGLIAELGVGSVAVHTAIFIYFIEENPRFLPAILPLFKQADQGKRELIMSALTLLEVLVVPYRAGNVWAAAGPRYRGSNLCLPESGDSNGASCGYDVRTLA